MPAPAQPPAKPNAGDGWTAWGDGVDAAVRYVNGLIDSVQSTATGAQTTANAAIPATQRAAVNGVATLDGGARLPVAQLPTTGLLTLDTATAPKKLAPVAAPGTSSSAAPADHIHPRGWWTATDLGYVACTYDPACVSGSATPSAAGAMQLARIHVDQVATVTNIEMVVATAGATLTTGQCLAALYTSAGALLASTADQATAWTSTGVKTMALATAQTVAAGDYYVGFWYQGTTAPAFSRQGNTAAINGKLTAPNLRYATANTGLTTTAPATLGTQTSANNAWFAALS